MPKRPNTDMDPASPSPVSDLTSLRSLFNENLAPINDRLASIEKSVQESMKDMQQIKAEIQKIASLEAASTKQAEVIGSIQRENNHYKAELCNLKKENSQLKEQLLNMESQSRRVNLQFHSIAEDKKENCERIILNILNKVGLDISAQQIERCHRLGPYRSNRSRPVIVRFLSYKDRQSVFEVRKTIKDSCDVRVSEDFPPEIAARRKKLYPILDAAYRYRSPENPDGESPYKARIIVDKLMLNGKLYSVNELDTLPDPLKPANVATPSKGNLLAFFTAASPLSNHHPSPFTVNTAKYSSMEQYIMYQKCLLFGDTDNGVKVMQTDDPVKQKAIGKKVANFDKNQWENAVPQIILLGLRSKFAQNPRCAKFLKDTGDKVIGEACESKFWGIGMGLRHENLWDQRRWADNLMGKSLMEIRGDL